MLHSLVSRRAFLNAIGGAAAAVAIPGLTFASDRRFAFVATSDGIHTMEPSGGGWRSRSFIRADAPRAMALSSDGRTLYVANGTHSYRSLPTGSVTAYRVAAGGSLHRIESSQLALSAVHPYALTLSPDDSLLAIASEGGVLSLLALQPGGRPGQVIAAHKTLTLEQLRVRFDTHGILRVGDGTAERTFRVSSLEGFELLSTGPSTMEEAAELDTFGITDAKAALCVFA